MHAILFCDVAATDGLDEIPLNCVSAVGVADDDASAIDKVVAHFAAQPVLAEQFRDKSSLLVRTERFERERDQRNKLWFLRGAGRKGDEIHAGYGNTTLYRIIEI